MCLIATHICLKDQGHLKVRVKITQYHDKNQFSVNCKYFSDQCVK